VLIHLLEVKCYLDKYPELLRTLGALAPRFLENYGNETGYFYIDEANFNSLIRELCQNHWKQIIEKLPEFIFWSFQQRQKTANLAESIILSVCTKRGIDISPFQCKKTSSKVVTGNRFNKPVYFGKDDFNDMLKTAHFKSLPLWGSLVNCYMDLAAISDSVQGKTLWTTLCSSPSQLFDSTFHYFGFFPGEKNWKQITIDPILSYKWVCIETCDDGSMLTGSIAFHTETETSQPLFIAGYPADFAKKHSAIMNMFVTKPVTGSRTFKDSVLIESIEYDVPDAEKAISKIIITNTYRNDSLLEEQGETNGNVVTNYSPDSNSYFFDTAGLRIEARIEVVIAERKIMLGKITQTVVGCGDGECDHYGTGLGTPWFTDLNHDNLLDIAILSSDGALFFIREPGDSFKRHE
jgi:hypothetical protein